VSSWQLPSAAIRPTRDRTSAESRPERRRGASCVSARKLWCTRRASFRKKGCSGSRIGISNPSHEVTKPSVVIARARQSDFHDGHPGVEQSTDLQSAVFLFTSLFSVAAAARRPLRGGCPTSILSHLGTSGATRAGPDRDWQRAARRAAGVRLDRNGYDPGRQDAENGTLLQTVCTQLETSFFGLTGGASARSGGTPGISSPSW
jgi:hypothetical protein